MTVHPIDRLVGSKIRARRVELGLSQMELANKLGTTKRKIECYEGGQRLPCSGLYHLAQALEREPCWFFKEWEIGGE
jgi:transcriptional regulator with XRE-family HTH domain